MNFEQLDKGSGCANFEAVMRTPTHPTREQITLPGVLEALSDPTRLAMALMLAERRNAETVCGDFLSFGSKTNLSYHLAKMREAGVTRVRVEGTRRYISIRWEDLDARFPGLIDWLLNSAKREGLNVVAAAPPKRAPRRAARARNATARRKPAA